MLGCIHQSLMPVSIKVFELTLHSSVIPSMLNDPQLIGIPYAVKIYFANLELRYFVKE